MRLFHIATAADWDAARTDGSYTTSTRGRTLAEEGFIHLSRGDQWQAVRARWYADVTEPLVLLVIDPELLTSPVVDEPVPGTDETFPHLFGTLDLGAVLRTIPLGDELVPDPEPTAGPATAPPAPSASFSRLFLEEMMRNVLLATVVLVVVVALTLVGLVVSDTWGPLAGSAVGLVLGVLLARRLPRRQDQS